MGFIVILYLRLSYSSIQTLVNEFLLITEFEQRLPVSLQFLIDILLALGKFHVCSPGIDVLQSEFHTVLRRCGVRNVRIQLGIIQFVATDFCHDFAVMDKRRNRLARKNCRQDDYDKA